MVRDKCKNKTLGNLCLLHIVHLYCSITYHIEIILNQIAKYVILNRNKFYL